MSLKSLLVLSILFLSACGNPGGRRHRTGNISAINGLSVNDLASFNRIIQTLNLEQLPSHFRAKDGDNIEYLVSYADVQEFKFNLKVDGPLKGKECRYQYKSASIKERLTVVDEKLTASEIIRTPLEAVFLDIPGPFKNQCDLEAADNYSEPAKRIDLPSRLVTFKKNLINNFTTLIDVCKQRKELKFGRCFELKVNRLKLEAANNFPGNRFIFDSLVESGGESRSYKSYFTLDFVHFYFGGLLFQNGESGVLVDKKMQLLRLELVCLNSNCF